MQKDQDYYTGLLSAYIDDRLDPAQVEELFAFIQLEPMAYRSLLDEPAIQQQLAEKAIDLQIPVPDAVTDSIWQRLQQSTTRNNTKRIYRMISYAAALLALVAGIYLLTKRPPTPSTDALPAITAINIPPGTNKATLTLAGGQQIILDSGAHGQLAIQGNTTITQNEGHITYDANGPATALQNTLTTPRGGQYQLTLPDGTQVWVNAASSITYPTAFTGKERRVTIKGEAFFEIAQNKNQPFIVEISGGPQIQVLGTQFNINAYADEPAIRTTLVNGSIKVQYNHQSVVLKPEQQAAADGNKLTIIQKPNIDEVLAWKNGTFLFNRTPLDIVMRQLSRWYDIDIVYTSGVPPISFEGEMKRDLNLSEVLNILRKMEVHCKMDGRRLIVLP